MSGKITNAVLASKMDGLHENLDEFKKTIREEIIPEVRENTKFRNQAKGIVAFVSFISMTIGGFLIWLAGKFLPSGK